MSETDADPDAETSAGPPIVFETKSAYATVGATIGGEQRIIELPENTDGDMQQFELPASEVDFAEELTRQNGNVSVVQDPTDRDLADVLTDKEERMERVRQKRRAKQRRKKERKTFDPREESDDRAYNRNRMKVRKAYTHLQETGRDEEAARLAELESVHEQKQYCFELREAGLFDGARVL
jgi:hypothetical protein